MILKPINTEILSARLKKMQDRYWSVFVGAQLRAGQFDDILVYPSSLIVVPGAAKPATKKRKHSRNANGGMHRSLTGDEFLNKCSVDDAEQDEEDKERQENKRKRAERAVQIQQEKKDSEERKAFKSKQAAAKTRANKKVSCYCFDPDCLDQDATSFFICSRKPCVSGSRIHKTCARLQDGMEATATVPEDWKCYYCRKMPIKHKSTPPVRPSVPLPNSIKRRPARLVLGSLVYGRASVKSLSDAGFLFATPLGSKRPAAAELDQPEPKRYCSCLLCCLSCAFYCARTQQARDRLSLCGRSKEDFCKCDECEDAVAACRCAPCDQNLCRECDRTC